MRLEHSLIRGYSASAHKLTIGWPGERTGSWEAPGYEEEMRRLSIQYVILACGALRL